MRFCEAKAKPYGEKALRSWIKWIDDATDGEGNFLNGLENVAVKKASLDIFRRNAAGRI